MRSFIFYAMVVLMILWTIVFAIELTYSYYASAAFETLKASAYTVSDFFVFYEALRLEIWSAASAIRLAVWALPMLVFAIISAVTQPAPR